MKAITLEEYYRIQADYKIPKDVRAEKEIEDLAFDTMEWEGWKRPESLMPDMEDPRARDGVLVIVSGTGKNTLYTHAICEACRKKKAEYDRGYRQMMKKLKICTVCKKVRVYGDETRCPECRNKDSMRHAEYDKRHREKIRIRDRETKRKLKAERAAKGLCIWCGKRAVTIGYKSCSICRKKRNDHYRNKYEKIHPVNRDEWSEHGWCYRCGDPVMKGKQLCERCYEQNVENSRLSASYQTHWWRNANKDIFRKGDASESRIKATS